MPRIGFRSTWLALLALAAVFPAAAAGSHGIPVPRCGWASAGLLSRSLGDSLRPQAPAWTTQLAPVLTCQYVERKPHLQLGGVALASIQFRELQRVRPPAGAIAVPHLGRCMTAAACPRPGKPAWLIEQRRVNPAGTGQAASVAFVGAAALEVQDGFDAIVIVVDNPNGPLPIASETAALKRIAKAILPRFYGSTPG